MIRLTAEQYKQIAEAEADYKADPSDANREALRDLYDWFEVADFQRAV
jgi:hypothetical protein